VGGKDMKIRYDREEDIVTFDVSSENIDHAEEIGPIIVHFSKQGKPVLLEILDASEFIAETTKVMAKSKGGKSAQVFS
jgi:uncharacterized protein YuzE